MQGLQEILAAEKDANMIIARANEEAERIVADAKRASVVAAASHEAELRRRREERLKTAAARLKSEKDKQLAETEKAVASIIKSARKRLPAAVALIVDSIRN